MQYDPVCLRPGPKAWTLPSARGEAGAYTGTSTEKISETVGQSLEHVPATSGERTDVHREASEQRRAQEAGSSD